MPDHRPQHMNLLVIGQSHVAAVRAAAKTHREAYPDEPRTRVIHTLEASYAPELVGVVGDDYRAARFASALVSAIEDQVARHTPRIASVIGGNAHNVLALLRHPRPFDFRLSTGEGPPLDPHAELVPEQLVAAALRSKMQADFVRLRLLRSIADPLIHIESPPPLRDERFIAARAEPWFRDHSGGDIRVAGAGLRWRIWRLASRLMRKAAEEAGVNFMAVPKETKDAEGFLRPEFAADPTHGNEAYGARLVRALQDFPLCGGTS